MTEDKRLVSISAAPIDSFFHAVKALVNHYSNKGYVLSVEIKVDASGRASGVIWDAE